MTNKTRKLSKKNKKHLTGVYNFLRVIQKLKAHEFNILIPYLSDVGIDQISQCVKNAICSEHISNKSRARLRKALWKHKNHIRYIAQKGNPASGKRKKLPIVGGSGITDIITTALPILVSLLAL